MPKSEKAKFIFSSFHALKDILKFNILSPIVISILILIFKQKTKNLFLAKKKNIY